MLSAYGGSSLEAWMDYESIYNPETVCEGHVDNLATNMYNGMVAPLQRMSIKGVAFYQGETNAYYLQWELYTCRFKVLVEQWRRQWYEGTNGATDRNFPFGFVQIGPLDNTPGPGALLSSAAFMQRMGATAGYGHAPNPELPNTFMATAFDLGDPVGAVCLAGCIHNSNKQATGHRLAAAARNQVYNDLFVTWTGPRVSEVFTRAFGDIITVVYSGPGVDWPSQGIRLRSTYGFEVCAESCSVRAAGGNIYNPVTKMGWAPAHVQLHLLSTVRVEYNRSLFDAQVTQLRYGYDDMPNVFYDTGPAVFNHEGLPATPGVYNITLYEGPVVS